MKDLFDINAIGNFGVLVFLFIVSLIQVAPIKINPWDTILGWIGERVNKKVKQQITNVDDKLNNHLEEDKQRRANDLRSQILVFANEVQRGIPHSQEQFRFMRTMCDEYDQYIHQNNLKNGVIDEATKLINSDYQKRLKKNDFLK